MTRLTQPPLISNSTWVVEPAYHTYPAWNHRVCYVDGLVSKMGLYVESDGTIPIDASIVHLIVELNRLGYITEFCCSGLPEDHKGPHSTISGYISFAEYCAPPRSLRPNGVIVEGKSMGDGFVWRFGLYREPLKVRAQWQELAERLGCTLDILTLP